MIQSTSSSYKKMMFCKNLFQWLRRVKCHFCISVIFSLALTSDHPLLLPGYISLFFCNLFVYWLWCPWFCILYSCIIFVLLTLMPLWCCRHRLFFLAAKIGMRWGNNEKKFFAKIKGNLFASVEKKQIYKHFQVYHFYSVFFAFM